MSKNVLCQQSQTHSFHRAPSILIHALGLAHSPAPRLFGDLADAPRLFLILLWRIYIFLVHVARRSLLDNYWK